MRVTPSKTSNRKYLRNQILSSIYIEDSKKYELRVKLSNFRWRNTLENCNWFVSNCKVNNFQVFEKKQF